jgi:hypothetical protein
MKKTFNVEYKSFESKYNDLSFSECLNKFFEFLKEIPPYENINPSNPSNENNKFKIIMYEIYEIFKYMNKMNLESLNELSKFENEEDEFLSQFKEISSNIENVHNILEKNKDDFTSISVNDNNNLTKHFKYFTKKLE